MSNILITVKQLNALADGTDDPEMKHSNADDLLLAHVSPKVREAYKRVQDSCSWWACA